MSRKGEGVSLQVSNIFREANMLDIGNHAGHKTKTEYRDMAREQGASGSHELAQNVPVTNSNTWENNTKVWCIDLAHYCRANNWGNDLRQIQPEAVRQYLCAKIDGTWTRGNSLGTGLTVGSINDIRAACNKLAACIEQHQPGIAAKIYEVTQEFRGAGAVPEAQQIRFNDPRQVIANIQDPACKAVATLQLECGLRVHDACRMRLNGDGHSIEVHAKAGHHFDRYDIGRERYEMVKQFANGRSEFSLTKISHYRYELSKACQAAGETMRRTHSFRHNYAYGRYHELRAEGYSHNEARAIVSQELFHARLDIVDRYIFG